MLKARVDALVQDAADDVVRGRVFSAYDVLYNVAFVTAGLLLVPLWRLGREQLLLWWLGAAFAAGAMLVARAYRSWPFHPGQERIGASRRRTMRVLAAVSGTVPVLAFPEAGQWWLGFVGLVPLILLLRAA